MKNLKIYLVAILAMTFVIQSCDEEDTILAQLEAENPLPDPVTGSPGASLNFSKYVAVGNSLTAGFMDNALYTSGQENSFPNLLSQQLSISGVGGGDFNQPDINSANGFSGTSGTNVIGRFELSLSLLRPVPTAGEAPTAFGGDKGALNNFGVPGMRLVDANDASLAVRNGLYGRFASNPGVSTVLGDAIQANGTFFSFWLGNNDILGYAAGGGANEAAITGQAEFQAALVESLGGLTQNGAQGVVMTIPQIVLTPFFRAVPYNAVPVTSQEQLDQLNAGFAGLNGALDGLAQFMLLTPEQANARKVTYSLGANPVLMHDDALDDIGPLFDALLGANAITAAQRAALEPFRQSRQATPLDLPTLTAATQIGQPLVVNGEPQPTLLIGVSYPAPDNLILSASEVETVVGTSARYNATIATVVAGINQGAGAEVITLVDVQPTFSDLFGLDAATARQLVDPLPGSSPFLTAMGDASAAAADGELGLRVNGVNLAPDFSPNGVFSTDGVHPNPRGYGIVVNLIINTLNASKGSSIPLMNVLALRGVLTTD